MQRRFSPRISPYQERKDVGIVVMSREIAGIKLVRLQACSLFIPTGIREKTPTR